LNLKKNANFYADLYKYFLLVRIFLIINTTALLHYFLHIFFYNEMFIKNECFKNEQFRCRKIFDSININKLW